MRGCFVLDWVAWPWVVTSQVRSQPHFQEQWVEELDQASGSLTGVDRADVDRVRDPIHSIQSQFSWSRRCGRGSGEETCSCRQLPGCCWGEWEGLYKVGLTGKLISKPQLIMEISFFYYCQKKQNNSFVIGSDRSSCM